MRYGLTFPILIFVFSSLVSTAWGQTTSDNRNEHVTDSNAERMQRQVELGTYALTHQGNVERGREIFNNEHRIGCVKCHRVDGKARSVGPNLFAIGNKFERQDLITSVLYPSKSIAIGYGTTLVATANGQVHQGVLQRVTDEWIELLDKDNKAIRIDSSTIDEQKELSVSIMPDGATANLTPDEFVDLIEYLTSLTQPADVETVRGVSHAIPVASGHVNLVPLFGTMTFDHPVWMGEIPESNVAALQHEGANFVVLEQAGRAYVVRLRGDKVTKDLLFDLTRSVRLGGATGLLGMAFHPQFVNNRRYFIKYQTIEQQRIQTVVEERRFPAGDETEISTSRLLAVAAVTQDHNGGCLAFGPDGDLYIGMGDSGPQGDPHGHGQDLRTLLGKILRIDVDHKEGGLPYAIPADNPFRNDPVARHEIWAYGFREPWRFSFDFETSELWVGDVGQNRFEEVAIVRAGENHGWNVFEGHGDHSQTFKRKEGNYIDPVFSYPREQGVSVTGGFVYRGRKAPQIRGCYIVGDFESRRIWILRHQDRVLTDLAEIGRSPSRIVSFSEGGDGELFLIGFDDGVVYHMEMSGVDTSHRISKTIAETSQDGPVLWRYTTVEPAANWNRADFDDSSWKLGPGGFGTDGTPGGIVRTDWRTSQIWLRRSFQIPHRIPKSSSVGLSLHHDEDAEVYLNGVEALRADRWTSTYVELPIDEKAKNSLQSGHNVIAIHCRQTGGGQYVDAGLIEYPKSRSAPNP